MKAIYFILILFSTMTAIAQVGINTLTPNADLEVNGNIKTGGLFLEDPGDNNNIRGSKFLVRSASNELMRYDINTSKYGPINYAEFVFSSLSTDGLLDYDTKISTAEYLVSIQGYSFGIVGSGRTGSVMPHSKNDDMNIEGYQIYAYKNTTTNTWFLRAFVNDSEFQRSTGGGYSNTSIDLYLNVMMYRKGFISKEQPDITLDMGNLTTGTAPLPTGF